MIPGMESRPRLAPGCRLDNKAQGSQMLLMPERALRLSGPSLEIVQRCDGERTVQQIISELQKVYSKALPQKVEHDILEYLELLQRERALDFE
jgi:pyrroloquinoline quinone biosynthesis protein D